VGEVGSPRSSPSLAGTSPPSPAEQATPRLAALLPRWLTEPADHLAQFIKYTWKVFNVPQRTVGLRDARRRPTIQTAEIVRSLLFTAILRLPSLNALEGELKRAPFQRLVGRQAPPGHKLFSADTAARSLDSLDHELLRRLLYDIIWKAERNKAFRNSGLGVRRPVALDGWETFCTYARRCDHCLVRRITINGHKVEQRYHRFVVAFLLGDGPEVVLDVEPLRTADLRRQDGEQTDKHDGEQTAALRLLARLHAEFGSFIGAVVLDALYANGPVMTDLTEYDYGGIITLKKETDEPLKDALALMSGQPPSQVWDDPDKKEHVEVWDVDEIETLDTFKGKVRVVRAEVSSSRTGKTTTWCAGVVGPRARQLSARTIHRLQRARWHEENTAFNQWTQLWNLSHVFRHKPGAVVAVLLLWLVAFNLMQLFVYRRLRRPRVPKDPCDTIRDLIAAMAQNICALKGLVPWALLLDSS
jgi:hypothetical protein